MVFRLFLFTQSATRFELDCNGNGLYSKAMSEEKRQRNKIICKQTSNNAAER